MAGVYDRRVWPRCAVRSAAPRRITHSHWIYPLRSTPWFGCVLFVYNTSTVLIVPANAVHWTRPNPCPMPAEPDYSRAALARFIEFVVAKGLVNPSTAQGWRVATGKVLEELTAEELADVRRIDAEATFRAFLHRHPGR